MLAQVSKEKNKMPQEKNIFLSFQNQKIKNKYINKSIFTS